MLSFKSRRTRRNMHSQPGLINLMLTALFVALTVVGGGQAEMKTNSPLAKSSSILRSDTTNDNTFHRSQSKRAATFTNSQTLISTAASFTVATAKELLQQSIINNGSNNGDDQRDSRPGLTTTMATFAPGITAALQANHIMSNRNVEQQKLDEQQYKITHNDNNNKNNNNINHNIINSINSIDNINNALFLQNSNNNQSTSTTFDSANVASTLSAAADEATATATTTTTTTTNNTPSTTTTTTTRRPVARTTLKPPPTIDDYQTIISQAGTHAYLPCNVKQLVKKPISWLRMRDGHILTVDQTTFIADQRFQSVFSPNPERWSLQIKYVQLKDEGTYECQVSTEPKASAIVHLRIVEPKTELIGQSTRHVKAGSQVKLRCIISQALEPPLFINWFYNQKQIYLHNRRGWRTEIERIDLPTELPTTTTATTTSTSTTTTAATTTTSSATTTRITAAASGGGGIGTANDMGTITRSYILDAIAVSNGNVLPSATATPMHTAASMSLATVADAAPATATVAVATAAISASDTPAILTLAATAASAAATTSVAATTTTVTTFETSTPETTTTTAATTTTTSTMPTTTTTTMLPSSSFIKQITTASLIIPAVVKLDSGNYTCSPSNSAPRTIVLHVLNGEYSASAIKSASVSWTTLIGRPGCLRWPNVSTILTLLWIIKFVLTGNVLTICSNRDRNKVNNRPAPQEPKRMTTCATDSRRLCTQTKSPSHCHSYNHGPVHVHVHGHNHTPRQRHSQTQALSQRQSQSQTTTRRQRRFGLGCGCGCWGHVSSSISGTKVAEDKT